MCRLLAYAAPRAMTAAEVLGADRHAVFQDMARLHGDGWGTAWIEHGDVRAERHETPQDRAVIGWRRTPASGLGHAGLTAALAAEPATARVVHLRLASDGMVCAARNTHPFRAGDLAFAHNGALVPEHDLDDLIAPIIRRTIRGETDSERYFAVLRTALLGDLPFTDAIVGAVRAVRRRFPGASMNALLLSPTRLTVIHASRDARIPTEVFEESGLGDALPAAHDERYYRMHVRRGADGSIAFASTGLDVSDWEELPPESVTVVDLATLTLETRQLALASV